MAKIMWVVIKHRLSVSVSEFTLSVGPTLMWSVPCCLEKDMIIRIKNFSRWENVSAKYLRCWTKTWNWTFSHSFDFYHITKEDWVKFLLKTCLKSSVTHGHWHKLSICELTTDHNPDVLVCDSRSIFLWWGFLNFHPCFAPWFYGGVILNFAAKFTEMNEYLHAIIRKKIQARKVNEEGEPRDFIEGYLKALKENKDLEDWSSLITEDFFVVGITY